MGLEYKDYYATLGVPKTATPDEIKQAFRKLARIHHPDVAKNKVTGEAKFKDINEAYEVLGDPDKRRRYDELGANWQDGGDGAGPGAGAGFRRRGAPAGGRPNVDFEFGGTGFSDFFESFFGSSGRSGRNPFAERAAPDGDYGTEYAQPGRDVEADILVTLEEALKGSKRKVTLRRADEDGRETRSDTYQVRIPAGVHEGQRIRLSGQGSAGFGGGAAGDLYLRVRLARHPDFTVDGSDLFYDLDIAPWEAALGVQVKVPALDGVTSLKVPPHTSSGGKLRLRGLGLPKEDGKRGDLYAVVAIKLPETSSTEERALWEKLAAASTFKPRKES